MFFVITDSDDHPNGHVLCVNLTDARGYHGDGFFLYPGDHPFINKKSVLYFPEAFVTTVQMIDNGIKQGLVEAFDDCDAKVLAKIVEKCKQTQYLPKEFKPLLHPHRPPKR